MLRLKLVSRPWLYLGLVFLGAWRSLVDQRAGLLIRAVYRPLMGRRRADRKTVGEVYRVVPFHLYQGGMAGEKLFALKS